MTDDKLKLKLIRFDAVGPWARLWRLLRLLPDSWTPIVAKILTARSNVVMTDELYYHPDFADISWVCGLVFNIHAVYVRGRVVTHHPLALRQVMGVAQIVERERHWPIEIRPNDQWVIPLRLRM